MDKDLDSRSFLIVAACDSALAQELSLPASIVLMHPGEALTLGGDDVVIAALASRVIGAMAFSETGHAELKQLVDGWTSKTGDEPPSLVDLSQTPDPQERLTIALRKIAQLYRARMGGFVTHNARLLQQTATLRIAQEETLAERDAVENFLLQSQNVRRWQVVSHGPFLGDETALFELSAGTNLSQLLAASSSGFSDVSFMLADQDIPSEGSLTASLYLVESDQIIAQWTLPASDLSAGWQRLSMIRALGYDEQSLQLSLEWQGEGRLLVAGSIHHPDPAYCVKMGDATYDRVLAHQVWKYLPGSPAPIPENAHWIGSPMPERFYIEPARLETASPAGPNTECLQYFAGLEALQVHPFDGTISAGRIARGVPPSIRQISAMVGGRADNGPNIEYALAVAPLHPARDLNDLIMDCEQHGRISDWLPLARDAQQELSLYLRTPTDSMADLYLLTRLAPGARQHWAWATFRNIWLSA